MCARVHLPNEPPLGDSPIHARVHRPTHARVRSNCEELTKLGQGGQGTVYLARYIKTQKLFALKETYDYQVSHGKPREVHILKNIIGKHGNIVRLWEY